MRKKNDRRALAILSRTSSFRVAQAHPRRVDGKDAAFPPRQVIQLR